MIAQIIRHKIVKGNLNALIGNMAQALFGILTFLLLVHHPDQYRFGKLVIFITVATLLDILGRILLSCWTKLLFIMPPRSAPE